MTLKMYEVLDFASFFEKAKSQRLPFKTAYQLTLLSKEIEKHTAFYQEGLQQLISDYAQRDEDGNYIPTSDNQGVLLKPEHLEEVNKKLVELRELDVELPDISFSPVTFETMELSLDEISIIMPFIKE